MIIKFIFFVLNSVNITVLSNSTTFNRFCTLLMDLEHCSTNLFHLNEMIDAIRFNFDNHLSVLFLKQT